MKDTIVEGKPVQRGATVPDKKQYRSLLIGSGKAVPNSKEAVAEFEAQEARRAEKARVREARLKGEDPFAEKGKGKGGGQGGNAGGGNAS